MEIILASGTLIPNSKNLWSVTLSIGVTNEASGEEKIKWIVLHTGQTDEDNFYSVGDVYDKLSSKVLFNRIIEEFDNIHYTPSPQERNEIEGFVVGLYDKMDGTWKVVG